MRQANNTRFSFVQAITNLTPAFLLSKKQHETRLVRQFNKQLLDRVLESRQPAHLLSRDIYGPLPRGTFSVLGDTEQRFSPGFSIDAIHFVNLSPPSRENRRSAPHLAFLLRKTDGGLENIVVSCEDVGRFGFESGFLLQRLVSWGCDNEITLALVKEEWLWHSLKSRDPRELCVVHPQKAKTDLAALHAGFEELIRHGASELTSSLQARLEQEDDLRVKAGGRLVRSVQQAERERLAALLPEEIVDKGLALGESLILSETIKPAEPSRTLALSGRSRQSLPSDSASPSPDAGAHCPPRRL